MKVRNTDPQQGVEIYFRLRDPDTGDQLEPADALVVEAQQLPQLGTNLFPPLSLGPNQEIQGHIWFFGNAPNVMPIRMVVIEERLLGGSWEVPLAPSLVKLAKETDRYVIIPRDPERDMIVTDANGVTAVQQRLDLGKRP